MTNFDDIPELIFMDFLCDVVRKTTTGHQKIIHWASVLFDHIRAYYQTSRTNPVELSISNIHYIHDVYNTCITKLEKKNITITIFNFFKCAFMIMSYRHHITSDLSTMRMDEYSFQMYLSIIDMGITQLNFGYDWIYSKNEQSHIAIQKIVDELNKL